MVSYTWEPVPPSPLVARCLSSSGFLLLPSKGHCLSCQRAEEAATLGGHSLLQAGFGGADKWLQLWPWPWCGPAPWAKPGGVLLSVKLIS